MKTTMFQKTIPFFAVIGALLSWSSVARTQEKAPPPAAQGQGEAPQLVLHLSGKKPPADKGTFDLHIEDCIEVSIENKGKTAVTLAGPREGSDRAWRTPIIGVSIINAKDAKTKHPDTMPPDTGMPTCGNIPSGDLLFTLAPGQTRTGIFTVGGTPPGIQWTGQVLPQALFKIAGAGKWAFIQLICSGRMYTDDNNVTHTLSSNGVWALDGSYPYPFWHTLGPPDLPGLDDSNYGDPDDNTPDTTDDTPSSALADDMKTFIVNEKFETYMMYRPKDIGFGCQWVPLHRISWNWFANIFRPGASWSNYDPMPAYLGPVNVTENIRWKQHPLWNIANFADEDTWDP